MERLRGSGVWLLMLLLLFAPIGCGRQSLPPDYRDAPFSARIGWEENGEELEARVIRGADGEVVLELLEPEGLRGITLVSVGGRLLIRCGETEMDGSPWEPLFSVTELLLPRGERRAVCQTKWEGEDVLYVEIEQTEIELYVDMESGIPKEIRRGGRALRILSFEMLEREGET